MFDDLMQGLSAMRRAFLKNNLTLPAEITLTFDDIGEAAKAKMELRHTAMSAYPHRTDPTELEMMGFKVNFRFKDKVHVINERPI